MAIGLSAWLMSHRLLKTPIDVPCPLALVIPATIATVEEVTIDSPRRARRTREMLPINPTIR
jgi:hypothetical protein